MEGNDRGNTRPKQRPRRRRTGALPRLDELQQGVSMPIIAKHPLTSQVRVTASTRTQQTPASQQECFSEDQRSTLLAPAAPEQHLASSMHPMEDTSKQTGLLPQPRGHTAKRQNTAQGQNLAREAVTFSRSWHRASAQEQPHQRAAIMPPDGHAYWSRQKGATLTPQKSLQAPSLPNTGPPTAPPLIAQNPRTSYPFLQTKASFEGMWKQLEATIQSREGMLMNMKAEMEKRLSLVQNAKVDAVKEKEEVEARKAEVMQNLGSINKQTGRIKGVREGLEQISTDLSVQVAELNLLLQHAQEQQRVLELLESLKEHYDASENGNRNYMDQNLQECEVKLTTMEKELECSKRTSEVLEKAAVKKIGDLEEIEAGGMLSEAQTNTQTSQTLSKMGTLETSPGLHESRGRSGHVANLKVPKLEMFEEERMASVPYRAKIDTALVSTNPL